MNCQNCGNPLTPEDKFCKKCGTPVISAATSAVTPISEPIPVTEPVPAPVSEPTPVPAAPVEMPAIPEPTPVQEPVPNPVPEQNMVSPGMGAPVNNQGMGPMPNPPMGMQGAQQMPAPMGQPMGPMPMNGQAPMPAPMGQMPMGAMPPQPEKKTNPILLIIIAVLAIAAGYFAYKALFADGGNGGGIVSKATKTVNYNGYSFQVPSEYTTSITADGLEMETSSVFFALDISTASYATANFDALNGDQNGYVFSHKGEKTYNTSKYHLYEVAKGTVKFYYVVFDMGGTRIGEGMIGSNINPQSFPASSYIDEFMKIAATAKYTGSNSIETKDFHLGEINDFFEGNLEGNEVVEEENTGDVLDTNGDVYVNVIVDEVNE